MPPRRHRMREHQRRDSAREWIRSGAKVTVRTYAKHYGVDSYTAYDDLTAIGFTLPVSAQRWAKRPPASSRRLSRQPIDHVDTDWIVLDGRLFFVAGYTPGGAPYGVFEDEIEDLPDTPDW